MPASFWNRVVYFISDLGGRVGLRTRFILIGLAAAVPIAAVLGHFAQEEHERAQSAALHRVTDLAHLASEREAHLIVQARSLLTFLANAPEVQAGGEACDRFLTRYIGFYPWLGEMRLSAPDGSGLCADRPGAEGPNLADRNYFQRVLAGEAFAVSELLTDRISSEQRIVAAVPVEQGGDLVGVLSAGIVLDIFGTHLPSGQDSAEELVAWIVDRNGTLIARVPDAPKRTGEQLGDEPVVQMALRDPEGAGMVEDLEGVPRLFAFSSLPGTDAVVAVGMDRASVVGPIERAAFERLLLIAGIFAGSVIIGLLGSEFLILSPLRGLARTASALERGDLSARADRRGVGEVGALSGALDRMAAAIEEREKQLQEAKRAAEQAYGRAEHASRAKTDFVASMSHEIRTPLNGIMGYTELIMDGELDPDQRRYAERIEAAASALLTVVNDILNFSRIEAGEVVLSTQPFSLAAMIDNTVSIVRSFADRKEIPIRIRLDPELPDLVVGDEARLRQVLLNLLNNAVKFTAKGHVSFIVDRITSAEAVDTFRFSVSDTGIGIPEDKRERLFRRFSQVHRTGRTEYGGTGLGLAISKRLVDLMGGIIGVESKEGRGSTFWVEISLPRGEAAALAEAREHARGTLRPARVLVADDLTMNQEIATAMLAAAGHQADVVSDGSEAVEAVKKNTYDIVLMDVLMGNMDGITATRFIRGLESPARDVPIIAMTANVLPQQIRAFKQAGMNGHLGKPFTRHDLLETIERYVSGSAAEFDAMEGPVPPADEGFDEKAFQDMRALLSADRTAAWLTSLRQQLSALLASAANASPDRDKLARTAHSLVSHAGSLGFTEVSRLSRALEEACLSGRDISDELRTVHVACEAALRTLDRLDSDIEDEVHA